MRQGGRIVRHVIFAVVLVGASFLGGAFVNGPGLKWLQIKVLGHAGLSEDVPSLTLPAAVASGSENDSGPSENPPAAPATAKKSAEKPNTPSAIPVAAGAPRPEPEPEPEPEPAAGGKSGLSNMLGSILSLGDAPASKQSATPPTASQTVKSAKSPNAKPKPPLSDASKPTAVARAKVDGPAAAGDVPGLPAMPAPEPRERERPAPLDPSVTPAFLASLTSPSSGSDSDSHGRKVPVAQASAASEPRPLPLPLPVARDDAAGGHPAPASESASTADAWGAIRRKLQAMGVARYTIEGVPGGRVTFSCLIPLAGRQAVTQRFEAEGDDELKAARAALRRIVLWQATEHDRPGR
jgi:hypothetical protein